MTIVKKSSGKLTLPVRIDGLDENVRIFIAADKNFESRLVLIEEGQKSGLHAFERIGGYRYDDQSPLSILSFHRDDLRELRKTRWAPGRPEIQKDDPAPVLAHDVRDIAGLYDSRCVF